MPGILPQFLGSIRVLWFFLLSHKLFIYFLGYFILRHKKGANQFHSVLKVLDYLYTKNENQLTPMGIC